MGTSDRRYGTETCGGEQPVKRGVGSSPGEVESFKAKLIDHSNHSEIYFDRIYDLEHWREVQEARRVNRVSSPIDLTGDPDSDSEDEVVEIPGFPVEFPRTLVPLEGVPAPGEVFILFP